jgi:hypothetical protein
MGCPKAAVNSCLKFSSLVICALRVRFEKGARQQARDQNEKTKIQ